ncbi:LysR family transcriptional regulator, partial [Cylindrospermopsis raciborskii CS-506_D]
MDQLQGMRVFCAVADALGFRAAANRLGMSATMISKHVTALETRVGARLFARNSRRVVLTDEGRAYYQRAKALLDELDELEASVRKQAKQIGGLIRVSAPVWMANERFAAILQSFTAEHPG